MYPQGQERNRRPSSGVSIVFPLSLEADKLLEMPSGLHHFQLQSRCTCARTLSTLTLTLRRRWCLVGVDWAGRTWVAVAVAPLRVDDVLLRVRVRLHAHLLRRLKENHISVNQPPVPLFPKPSSAIMHV